MECASTFFFLVFLNLKSSILVMLCADLIAANSVCSVCRTALKNKIIFAFFIKYLCNLYCQVLTPLYARVRSK